jgi:EH domain-containing protein 1
VCTHQSFLTGDFPDIKKMQESLQNQDFSRFHSLKPHLLEVVDQMLAKDIARLIEMIPHEESQLESEATIKGKSPINYIIANEFEKR